MKIIQVDLPPVVKGLVTDIPFLIKCAETARDNDDALTKNIEIVAKRLVRNEKQFDAYKAKANARINRVNEESEE